MQHLKMNQCKGKPIVCPYNKSKMIRVCISLFAALTMFSMATVAIAQWPKPASPPPTLEEQRLMNNYPDRDRIPNYYKELQSYKRDGCKVYFYGEWQRDGKGDRVRIEYNEKNNVFEGKVTRSVSWGYNIGHLLFRVDLKKTNVGIQLPGTGPHTIKKSTKKMKTDSNNEMEGELFPADITAKYMDINWLRQQRECRISLFVGKEYSFNQTTKNPIVTDIELILNNNKLEYMVEKRSATFTRVAE